MRTPLLAGNWKLNCLRDEARALAQAIVDGCQGTSGREIMVAPTYTSLDVVADVVAGSGVGLGAQNVYWETGGAFTGEVSAEMLRDARCTHVIIGHSERRQFFGETDYTVARKVAATVERDLAAVVCVGESLDQREAGTTMAVIEKQITGGLCELPAEHYPRLIIAYEPVWAIGTGKTASPDQAEEVHASIRKLLETVLTADAASATRILYGGSVKPDNVDELMSCPNVDGALVGGASLKADDFLRIVNFEER